jgi:hypothetical protein
MERVPLCQAHLSRLKHKDLHRSHQKEASRERVSILKQEGVRARGKRMRL